MLDKKDMKIPETLTMLENNTEGCITFKFDLRECVTSTNTVLKGLASEGFPEGYVLIANEQTAGKGRLGRNFYSPSAAGLYMSLLLRPKLAAEKALYITTAAAVAVAEAIEETTNLTPEIKWVNDVFCNGKKVCGILTEAAFDAEGILKYAVLGMGINVNNPENGFPQDISNTAGSLGQDDIEGFKYHLAASVLSHFQAYYASLADKSFLDGYRRRSMLVGKKVFVISGTSSHSALVLGIDDEFHLLVRREDGTKEALSTGEVSVRLANQD